MELEHLWHRHLRLRRVLSMAYQARRWRSRRIDMLADALALTERDIVVRQRAPARLRHPPVTLQESMP